MLFGKGRYENLISIIVIVVMVGAILIPFVPVAKGDHHVENVSDTYNPKHSFDICENKVVFYYNEQTANHDVMLLDLDTGIQKRLTKDPKASRFPMIYDNTVVYMDTRGTNPFDLYSYNLETDVETRLTSSSGSDRDHSIWGDKIVFSRGLTGGDHLMVYYLMNGTERTLVRSSAVIEETDIWGNIIVYMDNRRGKWDIYAYDLFNSTEWRISSGSGHEIYPSIYYDKIVWEDDRGSNDEIYLYDINEGKERMLLSSDWNLANPHIFEDKIVCTSMNWTSLKDELWFYDLSTNTSHLVHESSNTIYFPKMSSNRIVWLGVEDYTDNIYHTYIDQDGDEVYDWEDDFPKDPSEYSDLDEDGVGDMKDQDDDGDGYPDHSDAFPRDEDEWLDSDNDGIGNFADPDDDNDGIPDGEDPYPYNQLDHIKPTLEMIIEMINITGVEFFNEMNSIRENISISFMEMETSIIGRIDQLNGELADQIMGSLIETMERLDQINLTISELISSNWEIYHASEQGRFNEIMESMDGLHVRAVDLESHILTSIEETQGLTVQSKNELNASINEMGISLSGIQEYLHLRFLQLEDLLMLVNISLSAIVEGLYEELNMEMTGNTNELLEAMDELSGDEIDNITQVLILLDALTTSLEVLSQLEEVNDQIVEIDSELQKQGKTNEESDDSIKTFELINLLLLLLIAIIASIFLVRMVMENISKREEETWK